MRPSATSLAVGLLLSVALPIGVAAASDPGEQSMLAQANFWRTQHQLDRAADILNKLLALNPAQPDALYQKALLATEQGDNGAAERYFDRLRGLAPTDKRAAEIVALLAVPSASAPPAQLSTATAADVPGPAALPPIAGVTRRLWPDSSDLAPSKTSPPAVPAQLPGVTGGRRRRAGRSGTVHAGRRAAANDDFRQWRGRSAVGVGRSSGELDRIWGAQPERPRWRRWSWSRHRQSMIIIGWQT